MNTISQLAIKSGLFLSGRLANSFINQKGIKEFIFKWDLISPKDEFDDIYYYTAFNLQSELNFDDEILGLLLSKESMKSFKDWFNNGGSNQETDLFYDTLNSLLHTHPKIIENKNVNEFPKVYTENFREYFLKSLNPNSSPSVNSLSNKIDNITNQNNEILIKLNKFNIAPNVSLPNETFNEVKEEYEIQRKNALEVGETGNIGLALKQLYELLPKVELKNDTNLLYRVLTTIGVLNYRASDLDIAFTYLNRAYNIFPHNKLALSNIINVNIAISKIETARELTTVALNLFPTSKSIWAANIRLQTDEQKLEENLNNLPPDLQNDPLIVASIGICWRKLDNYKKSLTFLYKAESLSPKDLFIKEQLLTTIIDKYIGDFQLLNLRIISEDKKEELTLALKYIDEIETNGYLSKTKSLDYINLLRTKSLITSLLGDTDKALIILSEALKIDKVNSEIIQIKASLHLLLDQKNEAQELLEKVICGKHTPDAVWMLADLYYHNGNVKKSISLLENSLQIGDSSEERNVCLGVLLNILINEKKTSSLKEIKEQLKKFDQTIDLIFLSKIENTIEPESIEARNMVFKALEKINSQTTQRTKFILAETFIEFKEYAAAIQVYEMFIDKTANNDYTIKLAKLYYTIGRKYDCLQIFQNIRHKHGIIREYTLNEISIYQDYRCYPEIKSLATEHLKMYDDVYIEIILNGVNIRLGYLKEAHFFLKKDISIDKLELFEIEMYLDQLLFCGFYNKCLEVIYSYTLDKNDQYLKWLFKYEILGEEVKKSVQVEPDTIVTIKDREDQIVKWTILNKGCSNLNEYKINPTDTLFEIFKNKKCGDTIIFPASSKAWTISSIQNKYQQRFDHCLQYFELIPHDEFKVVSPQEQLLNIQANVREISELSADRMEIAGNEYAKFNLSIYTIAESLRIDIYSLIHIFNTNPKVGIRTNVGNGDDTKKAIYNFQNTNKVYADLTALLTIYKLKLGDILLRLWGPIAIGVFTYDIVFENYSLLLMFHKENDKSIIEIKELLSWLDEYTVQIRSEFFLKASVTDLDEKTSLFGDAACELLYLAKDEKGLLITDDYCFGQIAQNEHQINIGWSSALLHYLQLKGEITFQDYCNYCMTLVDQNYYHTSINQVILKLALEQSGYSYNSLFKKCLTYMNGDKSSLQTCIPIGLNFLFQLSKENVISQSQHRFICFMVFNSIATYNSLIDFIVGVEVYFFKRKVQLLVKVNDQNMHLLKTNFEEWKKLYGIK